MSAAAAPLLHVVGGGPWQLPTIRRAKARGLRVLVTDGWADRPGFALADHQAIADITDAAATLAVARRHRIDGIVCDTTDNGVGTAAAVAEALGLPGIGLEAARRCTDKALMADAARAAGLPVAPAHECGDAASALAAAAALGAPWVIKPVDNQSGRGVTCVREPDALAAAVAAAFAASRRGLILVQRLLEGPELIVDSLSVDGRAHVLGIALKTPYPDNSSIASGITYDVGQLPLPAEAIVRTHERLLAAAGLRQGMAHAEYIVHEGQPVPIDLAARGGGVMIYGVVLPHTSGVDTIGGSIALALGEALAVEPRRPLRGAHIEFLRAPPGRVVAFEGLERARTWPGVAAVHLNHGVGDRIGGLADKDDRLGFVIGLADTAPAAVASARGAVGAITVHVEPEPDTPDRAAP